MAVKQEQKTVQTTAQRSVLDIYREVVIFTGATPSKDLLERTPAEWDRMWGQVGR